MQRNRTDGPGGEYQTAVVSQPCRGFAGDGNEPDEKFISRCRIQPLGTITILQLPAKFSISLHYCCDNRKKLQYCKNQDGAGWDNGRSDGLLEWLCHGP